MKRDSLCLAFLVLALAALEPARVAAIGWYTPISWQSEVTGRGAPGFEGQRKNTTWIRDQNRDFIDDLIPARFTLSDSVDVAVTLNRALSAATIDSLFGNLGEIRYVGGVLTALLLNRVPVRQLESLARRPEVAMVELQTSILPSLVYSTRQIQARTTGSTQTGYGNSAQQRSQTGQDIRIAILDTGVDETSQAIDDPVAGFDAVLFSDLYTAPDNSNINPNGIDDSCEPSPVGNGVCTDSDDAPSAVGSNPAPCVNPTPNATPPCGHATAVAGVALGHGTSSEPCIMTDTKPSAETSLTASPYCTGTAPDAKLVDIKVCTRDNTPCAWQSVLSGLDWLAAHASSENIRVANLSFQQCEDNNPSGLINALVDYIVASGVTVVAGHGNFGKCGETERRQSPAPGSAAGAITVSAVNDNDQIERTNDTIYTDYIEGPRPLFDPTARPIDYSALKPDVCAPGVGIYTTKQGEAVKYEAREGTSFAAPHVSGVTAILLRAIESTLVPAQQVNPGSVADLIRRTADPPAAMSASFLLADGVTPDPDFPFWNKQFGMGVVNVNAAFVQREVPRLADVSFPNCIGANSPGRPCLLPAPRPSWENELDIRLQKDPPVANDPNEIVTTIKSTGGSSPDVVFVNFGTYVFGAGTKQFYPLARQQVTVPVNGTIDVAQAWIPKDNHHQCIQVSIDYGFDTQFWNNVTQRNVSVLPMFTPKDSSAPEGASGVPLPAEAEVRVENPYHVPAEFRVEVTGRPDWPCYAKPSQFRQDPFHELPRQVLVGISAPSRFKPGDHGDCHFRILGHPIGKPEEEVGGVTVQAFIPEECNTRVLVENGGGTPRDSITVEYGRAILPSSVSWETLSRRAVLSRSGQFTAHLEGRVPYRFRLTRRGMPAQEVVAAVKRCGAQPLRLRFGAEPPSGRGSGR